MEDTDVREEIPIHLILGASAVAKLGKKSRSCPSTEGERFLGGSWGHAPPQKLKMDPGNGISCDLSMDLLALICL